MHLVIQCCFIGAVQRLFLQRINVKNSYFIIVTNCCSKTINILFRQSLNLKFFSRFLKILYFIHEKIKKMTYERRNRQWLSGHYSLVSLFKLYSSHKVSSGSNHILALRGLRWVSMSPNIKIYKIATFKYTYINAYIRTYK